MKRIALGTLVALVVAATGALVVPRTANAVEQCGITTAFEPTYGMQDSINQKWDYKCNTKWQLETTLEWKDGSLWKIVHCGSSGSNCTLIHPSAGTFFGESTEHIQLNTYSPTGGYCGLNAFRVQLDVTDVSGNVLSSKVSPQITDTC